MRGRGNQRSLGLLLSAALLVLGAPGPSFAQAPPPNPVAPPAAPPPDGSTDPAPPAPDGEPELDEIAGKHLADGRAAAARGDWQAALTSFRAGVAVQEHPLLLLALGDAASHAGNHREVAEYLSLYLRSHGAKASEADRKAASTLLADATTRVGVLVITAPPGAELFVDNLFVGKAPIGHDVFVEPGSRSVEARSGKDRGQQMITAEKGARTAVTLIYGVVSPPPPPTATASAGPTIVPTTAPVPEGPRKEIVIGGAALAGAALVAGAVLLGVSAAKSDEERQARIDLRKLAKLGHTNLCAEDPVPGCATVKDTAAAKDTFGNTGSAILLGGVAAGAATLTYFLIKKYSGPSSTASRPSPPTVTGAAAVTPAGGAGFVTVRF